MGTPITTSTIVDVKKALHDGLSARTALHDVRVSYGLPHRNAPDEFLMIADVEGGRQETAAMRSPSTHPRQEEYAVTLLASVLLTTEDLRIADERVLQIVAEVEDYLRSDARLEADYAGGGRILWVLFGGITSLREYISDDGHRRESRATCAVEVAARI